MNEDAEFLDKCRKVGMDYSRWSCWYKLTYLEKEIGNLEGAIWDDPTDDTSRRELVSAYAEYARSIVSLMEEVANTLSVPDTMPKSET